MARKRRSAFVPRVIFGTVFVGVVPAVATCGGDDNSGGGGGTTIQGVAAGGFSVAGAGFFGVGVGGFGAVAAGGFGVAGGAFGGGGNSGGNRDASTDVGASDATTDTRGGGGAQDSGRDAKFLGVAAGGFAVAQQAFEVPPSKSR